MNSKLIDPAPRRPSQRTVYVVRMLSGGVLAGGFLGLCLGSAIELLGDLADFWTIGTNGIAVVGAVAAIFGGTWGLFLGLTDREVRRS